MSVALSSNCEKCVQLDRMDKIDRIVLRHLVDRTELWVLSKPLTGQKRIEINGSQNAETDSRTRKGRERSAMILLWILVVVIACQAMFFLRHNVDDLGAEVWDFPTPEMPKSVFSRTPLNRRRVFTAIRQAFCRQNKSWHSIGVQRTNVTDGYPKHPVHLVHPVENFFTTKN